MTHPWQSLCIFSGVKTIVTSYLKLKKKYIEIRQQFKDNIDGDLLVVVVVL